MTIALRKPLPVLPAPVRAVTPAAGTVAPRLPIDYAVHRADARRLRREAIAKTPPFLRAWLTGALAR